MMSKKRRGIREDTVENKQTVARLFGARGHGPVKTNENKLAILEWKQRKTERTAIRQFSHIFRRLWSLDRWEI